MADAIKPIDWEARARRFALKLADQSRTDQRILEQALRDARAAGWDEGFASAASAADRAYGGDNPYRTKET